MALTGMIMGKDKTTGMTTRCRAKNPATCPYHMKGTHKPYDKGELMASNEKIIRDSVIKDMESGGNSLNKSTKMVLGANGSSYYMNMQSINKEAKAGRVDPINASKAGQYAESSKDAYRKATGRDLDVVLAASSDGNTVKPIYSLKDFDEVKATTNGGEVRTYKINGDAASLDSITIDGKDYDTRSTNDDYLFAQGHDGTSVAQAPTGNLSSTVDALSDGGYKKVSLLSNGREILKGDPTSSSTSSDSIILSNASMPTVRKTIANGMSYID